MFSLVCARINGWVNNSEAGDLRRYRAHHDVIVMTGNAHKMVNKYHLQNYTFKIGATPPGDYGLLNWYPLARQIHNRTGQLIVRRAGLLWSQQDFEWRWSVPLFKCITVLEFSFILFDLCLLITFFNFIMNYVSIVTFWIFTYHKIWILSIMFCFIWSYWIIYFLACLEVSWRVVS